MLICLTGAHSTGKSTLICQLRWTYPFFKNYVISDSDITRDLKNKGLRINEEGNNNTQILIMAKHVANSLKKNALLGRCALDGLVYTRYLFLHGRVDSWVHDFALNTCKMLLPKYDHVFYLVPEFEIVPDGIRSCIQDFQNDIALLFDQVIAELSINPVKIAGTLVDQRMSQVMEALNE